MKIGLIILAGLMCVSLDGLSWNADGHRIIGQIAYDYLNATTKTYVNNYNRALNKIYKPQNFVQANTWLDTLRYQDIAWYAPMHYIDFAFSEDGTALPPMQEINAVWAIDNAIRTINNRYATPFDKGLALRILVHVVGDIHQPLHAITRVSQQYPSGDRGGNLKLIQSRPKSNNLHAYWDRGGQLLTRTQRKNSIKKRAAHLEKEFPCHLNSMDLNPMDWAKESNRLARKYAYTLKNNQIDKSYEDHVTALSKQQLAKAGCRLAALLNHLSDPKS